MINEDTSRNQSLLELQRLRRELEDLRQEKEDLEVLLETTTEHSTEIENELEERNEQVQRYMLAYQKEMQVGRQIQADFLPDSLPAAPGWQMTARFHPARDVAGDFYDAFALPGNRVGLVIADVCDKGVGAALFMSLYRSLMRVLASQAFSRLQYAGPNADAYLVQVGGGNTGQPSLLLPAYTFEALNTVKLVNDYIAVNHERANMFATLWFGVLDTQAGTISYVNGGHDNPILLGADGKIKGRLARCGPAVGIMSGAKYQMRQIQLEPGDVLIAYTDGVTDARSPDGTFFSEKGLLRLVETIYAKGDLSAEELLNNVSTEIQKHVATAEPSDDITMLAVRRANDSASEGSENGSTATSLQA